MLVKRTAMWTFSGRRTTCCRTSDSVGLFSLEHKAIPGSQNQDKVSLGPPRGERYSRVDALGDGRHDEEDGLGHLPGRVHLLERGVELPTEERGVSRSSSSCYLLVWTSFWFWTRQHVLVLPERNTPWTQPGRSRLSPGPTPSSGTLRSRRCPRGFRPVGGEEPRLWGGSEPGRTCRGGSYVVRVQLTVSG